MRDAQDGGAGLRDELCEIDVVVWSGEVLEVDVIRSECVVSEVKVDWRSVRIPEEEWVEDSTDGIGEF